MLQKKNSTQNGRESEVDEGKKERNTTTFCSLIGKNLSHKAYTKDFKQTSHKDTAKPKLNQHTTNHQRTEEDHHNS